MEFLRHPTRPTYRRILRSPGIGDSRYDYGYYVVIIIMIIGSISPKGPCTHIVYTSASM